MSTDLNLAFPLIMLSEVRAGVSSDVLSQRDGWEQCYSRLVGLFGLFQRILLDVTLDTLIKRELDRLERVPERQDWREVRNTDYRERWNTGELSHLGLPLGQPRTDKRFWMSGILGICKSSPTTARMSKVPLTARPPMSLVIKFFRQHRSC
jgi:hypothetical protein